MKKINFKRAFPEIEFDKTTLSYTVFGAAFGLCFPTVAMMIRFFHGMDLIEAHRQDELIWIIDLAPIILGIFGYIIGRKQALLEKHSETITDRFRMVCEGTNLALTEMNFNTGLFRYDNVWRKMVGEKRKNNFMTRDEFIANVHPDDLVEMVRARKEHLEHKTPIYEVTFRYKHAKGHWIHLHSRSKNINPNPNAPSIIVGTQTDVSERVNKEIIYDENRKQLAFSSKMASLGEMAGGIAHEINNPLAIISVKTSQLRSMLESGKMDKEMLMKGFDKIEDTVFRISRIIKGLRSISRNADNDPFEPTNIRNIFEDVSTLSKERYRMAGVELKMSEIPKIAISARGVQISQVLLNLMNNSFDAIEKLDEKWIDVNVTSDANKLKITITDSGKGIEPHILEKLMTPFFTTKDPGKGTGLGLSISKTIIEQHGGKFYYDKNCANTRFVIELPVANENKLKLAA